MRIVYFPEFPDVVCPRCAAVLKWEIGDYLDVEEMTNQTMNFDIASDSYSTRIKTVYFTNCPVCGYKKIKLKEIEKTIQSRKADIL